MPGDTDLRRKKGVLRGWNFSTAKLSTRMGAEGKSGLLVRRLKVIPRPLFPSPSARRIVRWIGEKYVGREGRAIIATRW